MRHVVAAFLAVLLLASSAFAWSGGGWAGSDIPGGSAAGGDMCDSATYPDGLCVEDDSHAHGVDSVTSLPRLAGPPVHSLWGGIPGANVQQQATISVLATGTTYYWPFVAHQSIDVTSGGTYVTVANGNAGAVMRMAIYNATSTWQPTSRALDCSTVAIDSTGSKTFTCSGTLPAGRYLIGVRLSHNTTTFEDFIYSLPDAPNLLAAATNGMVYVLFVVEASGAMPATGTAWTGGNVSTVPWACPVYLIWTLTP